VPVTSGTGFRLTKWCDVLHVSDWMTLLQFTFVDKFELCACSRHCASIPPLGG